MEVIINKITVGNWKENCYLISCEDEAWVLDPGDDTERIISTLNLNNYKLKGIINTHGHFDHIGAVAGIKEKYNIPFFIHSKDKRLLTQGNLYRRMVGDTTTYKTPVIDEYLDDLKCLELKEYKILIHYTPGHTNGGVCFEIDGKLFAGDMLLRKSISLSNLPGANKELMSSSLKYIFENFKGFLIYPGHGKSFILDGDSINKFKEMI
jgi:glyoxylase-like metal-dependent hydrolase (beta-lactamase superfamily II)